MHSDSRIQYNSFGDNHYDAPLESLYPRHSQQGRNSLQGRKSYRGLSRSSHYSYSESSGSRSRHHRHNSANSHGYSQHHCQSSDNLSFSQDTSPICKGMTQFVLIKHEVDAAVCLKDSHIDEARYQLEYLSREYPTCHIVWIELSRLELDLGNVQSSRVVVLKGLQYLPGNDTLLEKRVKIEERLRNCEGVLECAKQFLATNSTRCVKSIVEAAIVVAKLGYGYQASELFRNLMQRNLFTQGGVTLDYIRFVFKTEDYQKGLSLLKNTLAKLTKHGPIWFFTFSVLEQDHTVYWKRGDIGSRPRNQDLTYHLEQAQKCLPEDLQWKVFYIAAQAQLRSFTHIRLWTRMKKRYLQEYCASYPEVVRLCFDYLKNCVLLCPQDYQWKVWLLAGRVLALAGRRVSAIKVRGDEE